MIFQVGPVVWMISALMISSLIGVRSKDVVSSQWYNNLRQAPFLPPRYVFGLVWPFLYALIGLSGWFLWHSGKKPQLSLLKGLFVAQAILNLSWMPIFSLHRLDLALVCLVLLVVTVFFLVVKAWSSLRIVSFLLMPYLLWISFASCLNAYLWLYNPS
jgi:translocator protein